VPRFAANLTMLFNEVDFLARFEAAARAGFSGVEYLCPYAFSADELAKQLKVHQLTQVLHNLPAGNWDKGERGIAILPDRVDEFREGVKTAIGYAKALNCPQVNCLAGLVPDGVDAKVLNDTFVDNLKFAASALKAEGIKLLIEPINTRDIPKFYLTNTAQAVALINAVGSDNLFVQYDIYHMQIMEGDLAPTIESNLRHIAHIQLADTPGRHEPGTGEINYPFLFRHLDKIGYGGWIGCEYKPEKNTPEGLGWFAPYATPVK
jgi:hydroxypyruvate isomerase